MAGQGDDLQALEPEAGGTGDGAGGVAADDVVAGGILVHQREEGVLYARALLVDGVVERVDKVGDGINDFLLVQAAGGLHVEVGEFLAMVGKPLELYTLWMGKEEQIDGLVDGL